MKKKNTEHGDNAVFGEMHIILWKRIKEKSDDKVFREINSNT